MSSPLFERQNFRGNIGNNRGVMNQIDYDLSLSLFTSMRSIDPFRTDEVDTYSNILYTMKKQADLSQLAQHFMGVNRDRPEVSLVIGKHYYSLFTSGRHVLTHNSGVPQGIITLFETSMKKRSDTIKELFSCILRMERRGL